MAVGPIGNAIFVNQQTASAASVQNAHANRIDFQNMIAQATAQEKQKEVLEVRPAEENHEVDPDREHEKNKAEQETDRSEKREPNEDELHEDDYSKYKLDIKV
ncbi:MAG: hypothetical protein L3J10_02090 [Sulfurimonas sp.]|nr:hypothetical protein [Sulfurimonas sp.]